jgi:hypothetical protein
MSGYKVQNTFNNNTIANFSCTDPAVCINQCSANVSCSLALFQNAAQTCQLKTNMTVGQVLVPTTSDSAVYQKPQSGYSITSKSSKNLSLAGKPIFFFENVLSCTLKFGLVL